MCLNYIFKHYLYIFKFKDILQKVLKVKNLSSFHDSFNYNITYTLFLHSVQNFQNIIHNMNDLNTLIYIIQVYLSYICCN